MRIIVQKFGGTSLSTDHARKHAIDHIRQALSDNYVVVVVVSAMGRKGEPYATDTLLGWIEQNGNALPSREKDMLLCCGEWISVATLCSLLEAQGIPSAGLSGAQAGIVTNEAFGNAQIVSIDPKRILEYLHHGKVVVVAGFQGRSGNGDFTTLGRGGSDTSATALGAALNAEFVDIFTDVDGVLTADPRIVENARQLNEVSYSEICNMAHHGAKVIHPRAIEIAMEAGIPVRVRSTFSNGLGTLVSKTSWHTRSVNDRHVTGIAQTSDVTQIEVIAQEGQLDLQLQVFSIMAKHQISVDFINVTPSGVAYTVFNRDSGRAIQLLEEAGFQPKTIHHCAKVSVIGGGMNGVPGIMATIVEALTKEDIRILQSADSNTTIWVLVEGHDAERAVRALHFQFRLHEYE
jgi:aspartate kinase